jgi:hypothetical protein
MHSLKLLRRWLAVFAAGALAGPGLVVFAALPAPAQAAIPPNPAWESTAPFGTWQNGRFDVYNNEWNTSEAGPQTIWANSYHDWGVESTQADTTSVKTYPSVQENYNNPAYTSLRSLRSTFTQSMPAAANFDAEAAYDLWLNNYQFEVMMWVDNHGQTPAGSVIAEIHIYGKKFAVWQGSQDAYSFVLSGKQKAAGNVHLFSALRWLVNHGYMNPSATLTQVNFGWEIASTDAVPMDFTLTRYSLSTGWKGSPLAGLTGGDAQVVRR